MAEKRESNMAEKYHTTQRRVRLFIRDANSIKPGNRTSTYLGKAKIG